MSVEGKPNNNRNGITPHQWDIKHNRNAEHTHTLYEQMKVRGEDNYAHKLTCHKTKITNLKNNSYYVYIRHQGNTQ